MAINAPSPMATYTSFLFSSNLFTLLKSQAARSIKKCKTMEHQIPNVHKLLWKNNYTHNPYINTLVIDACNLVALSCVGSVTFNRENIHEMAAWSP